MILLERVIVRFRFSQVALSASFYNVLFEYDSEVEQVVPSHNFGLSMFIFSWKRDSCEFTGGWRRVALFFGDGVLTEGKMLED